MALLPSLELPSLLGPEERQRLLGIARASIRHGLAHGHPLPVDTDALPPALAEVRTSFVTLTLQGQLRGCIGRIRASRPLALDVADHAYAAAFQDGRFAPVTAGELDRLHIELSLLTVPEPLASAGDTGLMAQLVPGRDGLIIAGLGRQGVFLPSVWAGLPDPMAFLRHLKLKAGLPGDFPAERLEAFRFHTESMGEVER
jgi:hypothetical protein